MHIRRATPEDTAAIAAIHVRAWQEAYRDMIPADFLRSLSLEQREAAWHDALLHPTSDTRIAVDAGEILGWIDTGFSRDADADRNTGELRALYVAPGAWRRGVGTTLWRAAEVGLRAAEFRSVTLWVLDANRRALGFYEAIGFCVDAGHEKTIERGGAMLREVRLRLDLRRSDA
jgi:ribosomal protein S18 acetylase RimI-like enzyme